jgi:hypothetical protein
MFEDVSHTFTSQDTYPYAFVGEYNLASEVHEWCIRELGCPPIPTERWRYARYKNAGSFFYFRDKTDATAFKLRWC